MARMEARTVAEKIEVLWAAREVVIGEEMVAHGDAPYGSDLRQHPNREKIIRLLNLQNEIYALIVDLSPRQ